MPTQESQPRISINKLGEYLVAKTDKRRRRIIYDQKFPSGVITTRYGKFMPSVRDMVTNGGSAESVTETAEALRAQAKALGTTELAKKKNKWHIDNANNTAGALDLFLKLAPQILSKTRILLAPPKKNAYVMIAGVKVSIMPDYIVHQKVDGRDHQGAVKFHLIKGKQKHLGAVGAQHVAVLLQHWLEVNLPDAQRLPHHTLCLVVECWQSRVTVAPAKSEGRMENIISACREIAEIWPTIHRVPEAA